MKGTTIKSETKEEVFFPKLEKMNYTDGCEYLISCGYEKNGEYEVENFVSEYWKMTLSESDFYFDSEKSKEYNSSIISWEYENVKDNGYWNEVSSVGEE